MREYKAEAVIDATPEKIWDILINGEAYPDWDPGMDRIEGGFGLGEKVSFYTKVSPGQSFPVKITTFEPGHKMVLTGGMPLGLFKSERTHLLTPQPDGKTHFSTKEIFSGLMLPLIGRGIPDLTKNFEQFTAALKARAETA